MEINAAQIRALAEVVKDWPDHSVGEINPVVKGGVNNHEVIFTHGPFRRAVVLRKNGKAIHE